MVWDILKKVLMGRMMNLNPTENGDFWLNFNVGFSDAKPTDAPIMDTFGLLPKRHAKPIAAPPLPERAATPCCCGSKQLTWFLPLRACSIRMVYH